MELSALAMTNNYITEDGVKAHLVPFIPRLIGHFRIDLRENKDINCDAGDPLLAALSGLPEAWGVSVDMRGTGLTGDTMLKLLNQTPAAQMAAMAAAKERKRTEDLVAQYTSKQAELEARWAAEVDAGPPEGEAPEDPPFEPFPDGEVEKLKSVRSYLAKAAKDRYDRGDQAVWKKLPKNCGSGQLIAHLSYICKSATLRGCADFTLRQWQPAEGEPGGMLSLHDAVAQEALRIVACSGNEFGAGAATLKLQNLRDEELEIFVPAGSILQHANWVHLQNLLIGRGVHLVFQPGQTRECKLGAMCMNLSCQCSEGQAMQLTSFLLQDTHILESQGKVWDHFEALFARFREEAGFPDGAKKKGKGKKKGGKKKK